MNIAEFIKADSKQLNADDLVTGPITVRVERVTKGNKDRPVGIHISGGHQPWNPSKTALRVLGSQWGLETEVWCDRWVTLYRDPRTQFGGKVVGGVMPSAMSDIPRAVQLSLSFTRGQKMQHNIAVLKPADCKQTGESTADLHAFLEQEGATMGQLDAWGVSQGHKPASEMDAKAQSETAVWLAKNPEVVAAVKAIGGAE